MDETKPRAINVPLSPDEKLTSVMAYTDTYLYWGDVVSKSVIRVSTWLRTNAAPEYLCLYNGMALLPGSGSSLKPIAFPELNIPVARIVAFHILPPNFDPPDYDASEINRKMEPVSALVGQFRIDGCMRMSQKSDVKKYLEVSRENFTGLYDVTITHPGITHLNLPKVPYILVRQAATTFAIRLL